VPAGAGALALLAGMAGRRSVAAALETAARRRETIATGRAADAVADERTRSTVGTAVAAGQSR
jgi:hypothetical protein